MLKYFKGYLPYIIHRGYFNFLLSSLANISVERSSFIIMKLSSDRNYLVLENQGLVHSVARKFVSRSNFSEYEDIASVGMLGLVKAAITFDPSKNVMFSTYSVNCITHEIIMYCKKSNKYANVISINQPIGEDNGDKDITVLDTIADSASDFVEQIIDEEAFTHLVGIVLNYLKGTKRLAVLYSISNVPQESIAQKLNISRSRVSAIRKIAAKKIKKVTSYQIECEKIFSIEVVKDKYRLSFSSKDVSKVKEIFASVLQDLTSSGDNLPDVNIDCNGEQIVIQTPAYLEAFSFIAQFIQKLDGSNITFISEE